MAVCSLAAPKNSVVFTATNQPAAPLDFQGWGVLDLTAQPGVKWAFHQIQGWDPTQVLTDETTLLTTLFDVTGAVAAVPGLSLGSVPFQVLSAWLVAPPSGSGSIPAVPVVYQTTYQQLVGLVHAPSGCAGAFGQPLRHTFSAAFAQSGSWTVNLGTIAGQMNYPASSTLPSAPG